MNRDMKNAKSAQPKRDMNKKALHAPCDMEKKHITCCQP